MAHNRYYDGPVSDHFDGVRFFNPGQPTTDRGLSQLVRWQLGGERSRWTAGAVPGTQVTPEPRVDGLRVTMVGHATVLIQTAGRNLLVDPVWSDRASPSQWLGPRRANPPGVAFADLPPIDAVLVTHNHYDHLDLPTIGRLWEAHRPRMIAPLGNDRLIAPVVPGGAVETGDWETTIALDDALGVTLVPAHHWSARGLGDRRMALWCGFVIRSAAGMVYVVGDTGYGDGRIFADVRARFGPPDVAVIPIGAYEPRWFMKDQHVDPDEAVRILLACGAAQGLGVHWGTFQLTDEAQTAPREALGEARGRHGVAAGRFPALAPGDVWSADR